MKRLLLLAFLLLLPCHVEARHLYYYGKADWTGSRRTIHLTEKEAGASALWNTTSSLTLASTKASQWDDLSGSGYHLTQGDDAKRPTVGSLNGRRAIVFGGSQYMSANDAHALFDGTDLPLTVVIVSRVSTTTGNMCLFSATTATVGGGINSHMIWQQISGVRIMRVADAVTSKNTASGNSSTALQLLAYVNSGTAANVFINGSLDGDANQDLDVGAVSTNSVTLAGSAVNSTVNNLFNGTIGSVAVFSGALPTSIRVSIEQFERRFWRF